MLGGQRLNSRITWQSVVVHQSSFAFHPSLVSTLLSLITLIALLFHLPVTINSFFHLLQSQRLSLSLSVSLQFPD